MTPQQKTIKLLEGIAINLGENFGLNSAQRAEHLISDVKDIGLNQNFEPALQNLICDIENDLGDIEAALEQARVLLAAYQQAKDEAKAEIEAEAKAESEQQQ